MRSETLTVARVAAAARLLAQRDRDLGDIFRQLGPPPLWRRPLGFVTLVRIILEQQVSLASAESMFRRLSSAIDPLSPERFLSRGELAFRALGVTRQKSAYLLYLARAIDQGTLDFASLARMSDTNAKLALMSVKGIGSWSADIYLLMAMRRADVWPAGDLALATTITKVKRLNHRPNPTELTATAEAWRPYRAVAARMLWQHYLNQRARKV